jgi:hypothetical protein
MASGKIPDDAITASSTYSINHKPSCARLTRVCPCCVWAPTRAGKVGSWLQVNLEQLTTVTGIAAKAKSAMSYSVQYSTEPTSWILYEESGGKKVSQRINLVWGNHTEH